MRVHKQKRIDYERQWNNDALVHSTTVEWNMYDKVVLILLFYITLPLYFMVLCIIETQTQLLVLTLKKQTTPTGVIVWAQVAKLTPNTLTH